MFCLFDAMPTYTWYKNIEINYSCIDEIKTAFYSECEKQKP